MSLSTRCGRRGRRARSRSARAASADEYWVFFGTYTGKDGSKGIYRSKFDDATGKLGEPELAAEMGSPSFVDDPPEREVPLRGRRRRRQGRRAGGRVRPRRQDRQADEAERGQERRAGPCHISVHPKGDVTRSSPTTAAAARRVHSSARTASSASGTAFVQHKGNGKDPAARRSRTPTARSSTDRRRTACTVDLGLDRVKVFNVRRDRRASRRRRRRRTSSRRRAPARGTSPSPRTASSPTCAANSNSTVNVIDSKGRARWCSRSPHCRNR